MRSRLRSDAADGQQSLDVWFLVTVLWLAWRKGQHIVLPRKKKRAGLHQQADHCYQRAEKPAAVRCRRDIGKNCALHLRDSALGFRLEIAMKRNILCAILMAMCLVSPAFAANICLQTRDIVSTDSKDGKTLVFKMRDGRTLVNHLNGICPDLKFNGFSWVVRGTEEICENQQSLRVLRSGQICVLGKFDQPTNKSKAN